MCRQYYSTVQGNIIHVHEHVILCMYVCIHVQCTSLMNLTLVHVYVHVQLSPPSSVDLHMYMYNEITQRSTVNKFHVCVPYKNMA